MSLSLSLCWRMLLSHTSIDAHALSLSLSLTHTHTHTDFLSHTHSLIRYAVLCNDIGIVRNLLQTSLCTKKRLNTACFQVDFEGFEVLTKASVLFAAMGYACVEIVTMLLKSGATPNVTNNIGVDCLIFAATTGRCENVKFWLSRFSNWDVNRGDFITGATGKTHSLAFCHQKKICSSRYWSAKHENAALSLSLSLSTPHIYNTHLRTPNVALHYAVAFGRKKLKTIQALVDIGHANLNIRSRNGQSILANAVLYDDSDPDVVRYLLSKCLAYGVNYRRQAQQKKWAIFFWLAVRLFRTPFTKSRVLAKYAHDAGSTALQYAAVRGMCSQPSTHRYTHIHSSCFA